MGLKYVKLDGTEIDLVDLSVRQKNALTFAFAMYRAGCDYCAFVNMTVGSSNFLEFCGAEPDKNGQCWVDSKVYHSPLYQITNDLSHYLGMQQGFLGQGEDSVLTDNSPTLEEFLGIKG